MTVAASHDQVWWPPLTIKLKSRFVILCAPKKYYIISGLPKKETGESLHQKLITLLSFGKPNVNKKHMNTTELPNHQQDHK